jgi:hypothetical protein
MALFNLADKGGKENFDAFRDDIQRAQTSQNALYITGSKPTVLPDGSYRLANDPEYLRFQQPNDFTQLSQIDQMLMKEQNAIRALEDPVGYKKNSFGALMAIREECKNKYNQVYVRALKHGVPSDAAHKMAYDSANSDFRTNFSILNASQPTDIHDAFKEATYRSAGSAMGYKYLAK